jgi:hypothetical protein
MGASGNRADGRSGSDRQDDNDGTRRSGCDLPGDDGDVGPSPLRGARAIPSTNQRGVVEVGLWMEAADGEGGRRDREGGR